MHAEHLADRAHAERRPPESHRREARADEEIRHPRQHGDGLIGQAVADEGKPQVVAAYLERNDGKRWAAVRAHRGARRGRVGVRGGPKPERALGAAAVAQTLLAEVLDRGVHPARELVANRGRDDGLAGIRELGQAGGDVDAVPEDVERLDDDIGDVNADAQPERLCVACRVGTRQFLMQLEGAAHRQRRFGEFGEEAVAESARQAAAGVRRDDLSGGVGEKSAPALERALLIALHETRGIDGIGDQHRAPQPLRTPGGDMAQLLFRRRRARHLLGPGLARQPLERAQVGQHERAPLPLDKALPRQPRKLARHFGAPGADAVCNFPMAWSAFDARRVVGRARGARHA